MSDTMLLGILRMPFDLALSTPTARIQYHQRGLQAADEIEKLRAENERLRENVDRAGKEVERADRLRAEIARVKADERKNRAEIKRLRAKVAWLEKHSDEIEAKLEELRWP